MRSELSSNKEQDTSVLSFFKAQKKSWALVVALFVGVILLIAGGSSVGKASSSLGDEEKIERRLEELCSSLEGVGECKVMISCETVGKSYSASGTVRVQSVVILCRGGGSERVKRELTELVISLYGVGSNRVKIGVLRKS